MKKVYNYITIVKEGNDLKLGKNCGISCNRRNAMDRAHGKRTEIVAAINFPDMLPSTLDRVKAIAKTNKHIIYTLYDGLDYQPKEAFELILDRVEEIACGISKRARCEKYFDDIPNRWGY